MVHLIRAGVLGILLLPSCETGKDISQSAASIPTPPIGPSLEAVSAARKSVLAGVPLNVELDPSGAVDFPDVLERLRTKFLLPLAASPHANQIEKVIIEAGALEWHQWTCRIELKDYMNPISLTHFGGFYDGDSNDDPDPFAASRSYVLDQLNKIGRRVGW